MLADQGVELFTPWSWKEGMWKVLHLFARYQQDIRVESTSNDDEIVSAYSSINEDMNNLAVILVNRDLHQDQDVTVSLEDFNVTDRGLTTLQLSDLPDDETFTSHSDNALESGRVSMQGGTFTLTLPPLSITAALLPGELVESTDDAG